jgi:hypothetical protein
MEGIDMENIDMEGIDMECTDMEGIAVWRTLLTLSLEGSPALAVLRPMHLALNCLKLSIPEFLYNLIPVSCGDIA